MADKLPPSAKRTVLITGCSIGGLGSALALTFHAAGLHVYATARNLSKMQHLKDLGIETLTLDVLDPKSITACITQIPHLDILINNAGGVYSMPVSDLDIGKAKELFDLNVWSYISVTQAFLPLLLQSKGMIVNHTSIASLFTVPFQATYNASKAAIASYSDHMRLELAPFGITVIDLKTGLVKSNLIKSASRSMGENPKLPETSIYTLARETVEKQMSNEQFDDKGTDADTWAKQVVGDLLKGKPSSHLYRGQDANVIRVASCLPHRSLDWPMKKTRGLNEIESKVKEHS